MKTQTLPPHCIYVDTRTIKIANKSLRSTYLKLISEKHKVDIYNGKIRNVQNTDMVL